MDTSNKVVQHDQVIRYLAGYDAQADACCASSWTVAGTQEACGCRAWWQTIPGGCWGAAWTLGWLGKGWQLQQHAMVREGWAPNSRCGGSSPTAGHQVQKVLQRGTLHPWRVGVGGVQ